MAITFNSGSGTTTFNSSSSSQNVNFNGTSMCTVYFQPGSDGRNRILWDRTCLYFHSNNYANIEYRVWIPNSTSNLLCYCWRTTSQDGDSGVCWNRSNNCYLGSMYVGMRFRLVSRGNFGSGYITVSGSSECSSNSYTINIPQLVCTSTGACELYSGSGTGNQNQQILPPTSLGWNYGSLAIDRIIAYCWFFHGMSCSSGNLRWVPNGGWVCRYNGTYQCAGYSCTINSTTSVWCNCLTV